MNSTYSSQIEQYDRDGYAVFRNVLDADIIGEMRQHVEWLQANRSGQSSGGELFQLGRMNDDPFWVRVVGDDRLLDVAEQFVGPDIALFASGYFCKAARTGSRVLWHQDGSYWPLDPMEVTTLWLAVDDSTLENGCLRVIPGSHGSAFGENVPRPDVPNILGSGLRDDTVNEADAVDVVLRAGDVSVHHPNLIHGSNANTSPHRRCGLAIRYISATTRIIVEDGQQWPSAFFLRGERGIGINDYHPKPRFARDRHMPFRDAESWA